MNKKITIVVIIIALVIIGVISLFINSSRSTAVNTVPMTTVSSTPINLSSSPVVASSTVPLMQSTGSLFSQYKYYTKAHEVYPTLAVDTKKALGAFSYTKEDLGNGVYKFTLTNNAEGYKGQSVTVGLGQSVYFIEPASGDDSATEDSITTDDILMAVDAQGYILK